MKQFDSTIELCLVFFDHYGEANDQLRAFTYYLLLITHYFSPKGLVIELNNQGGTLHPFYCASVGLRLKQNSSSVSELH